ncbi:hypothetical protein IC582_029497 [Cucumis melo]
MEGRLLLDVVICKSSAIFQLFPSEDKSLLVWGNAFLVLNLSLHVVNCVRRLNLQGDGLPGESFDKNLHTTTESEDKMKSRFLLDVVISKSSSILQLLSGEDKSLLVWGNTFLILDLGLDVINGIGGLHLEGDSLSGKSLDKNLHATTEPEHEVESRFLLYIVIGKGSAVLKLLSSEDETLLVRGNSFLILNLGFNVVNSVGRLHLKGDRLSGKCFYKDLHATTKP